MAQAGVSTVGGYGSPIIQQDGSMLVDTEDGVPVIGPQLNPATGALSPAVINPIIPGGSGIPELNAILVELRLITRLLIANMGPLAEDPEQMRADELWNITIGQGTV